MGNFIYKSPRFITAVWHSQRIFYDFFTGDLSLPLALILTRRNSSNEPDIHGVDAYLHVFMRP